MLETVSRMFQMAGNNEVWIRKFIKMTLFNQNYLVSILYELKPLIHSRWNNKLVGGLVNRHFMDTDRNKKQRIIAPATRLQRPFVSQTLFARSAPLYLSLLA